MLLLTTLAGCLTAAPVESMGVPDLKKSEILPSLKGELVERRWELEHRLFLRDDEAAQNNGANENLFGLTGIPDGDEDGFLFVSAELNQNPYWPCTAGFTNLRDDGIPGQYTITDDFIVSQGSEGNFAVIDASGDHAVFCGPEDDSFRCIAGSQEELAFQTRRPQMFKDDVLAPYFASEVKRICSELREKLDVPTPTQVSPYPEVQAMIEEAEWRAQEANTPRTFTLTERPPKGMDGMGVLAHRMDGGWTHMGINQTASWQCQIIAADYGADRSLRDHTIYAQESFGGSFIVHKELEDTSLICDREGNEFTCELDKDGERKELADSSWALHLSKEINSTCMGFGI